MNEDIKATLGELEMYLSRESKLPIDRVPSYGINKCEHLKVLIDELSHTVTCKKCKKQLDAFSYLLLLAREWERRRYQDELAIKAWLELEQKRKNSEARGTIAVKPKEGLPLIVWESYEALMHKQPDYIYRMGSEWYVKEISEEQKGIRYGASLSFHYIKLELARKNRADV